MRLSRKVILFLILCVSTTQAQDSWFKYEVNKPYAFIGESKEIIQQRAGGQTVNVTTESNTSYAITILEYTEDGSMNAQIEIKSAISFTEGPQGLQTFGDELTKKTFTFTINKQGNVVDVDSTLRALKPQSQILVSQMMDFLPDLSGATLADGESWTREVKDTSGTNEQPIYSVRESEYEIDGTTEVDGVSTLHIKYEGEISRNGELTIGNQERIVMAEGNYNGNIYYAKELGIVKKIDVTSKVEEVYSLPSNPGSQAVITRTQSFTVEQISE